MIHLVGAASQLADLMNMTVFPRSWLPDLKDVVAGFPPSVQADVVGSFPEMAEWVALKVNEVETRLC